MNPSDDFFGKPAFLTVSGQLEAETVALGMTNVYTFGPTFRAENSATSRHLAEFWMVEPEMAFCDLEGNMNLAEEFLKEVIAHVLDTSGGDLSFFNQRIEPALLETLEHVATSRFERSDLYGGDQASGKCRRVFRVSGRMGSRSSVGARAVAHRDENRATRHPHRLPCGDQSLLHETQRGRKDGSRHGRACTPDRRDHRRISTRRAPRRAGGSPHRASPAQRALLVVHGSEKVWNRAPTRASVWASNGS